MDNTNNGVNMSDGVNRSHSVSRSYGVNGSDGVNGSHGVNRSGGVNWSYGVMNCFGVDHEIFAVNKGRTFRLFGSVIAKDYWHKVWETLHEKLNGWKPSFNNAFELFAKAGGKWRKVEVSKICDTMQGNKNPYEAWKDMPQEAIEYLQSLPEFDAEIFETVTGIKVNLMPCDSDG